MESEVIEGAIAGDLRAYAERLASGDEELLDDGETASAGAFVGEQLRRIISAPCVKARPSASCVYRWAGQRAR